MKIPDTSKMDWAWIEGSIVDYGVRPKQYVLWPRNIGGDLPPDLNEETQYEYWTMHLGSCGRRVEKYSPIASVLLANAPRMHNLLVRAYNGEDIKEEIKTLLKYMWEEDCDKFEYGVEMKEI